jgi:hypothetical protein
MNFLPKLTCLGKLNLIEVYIAYDEPCLFACKNASGQIFIAVLIDEDEDYTPLSKIRFEYIRSGGIDLHDGFKFAEDGFSYIVNVPIYEGNSKAEMISCDDISNNILPLSGEIIQLKTQTLPILSNDTLKETASSLWREILRFKVKFPDHARNEAPIKSWGSMLFSLQEVVESIGHKCRSEKRKIISQETQLLATVTSGGSYCVDLVAATHVNLLKDSLVGESLDIFMKLIRASNKCTFDESLQSDSSNEEFAILVNNLGKRLASKYRIFLTSVADAKSDIDFDWGSPHAERGGSATLKHTSVITTLHIINKMEINIPEIREVTGTLIGGNIESKRFELRDIHEEFKYKGEVSSSLIASDTDMTLDYIYKATIEETVEVNRVTGEVKPKYKLTNLIRLRLELDENPG